LWREIELLQLDDPQWKLWPTVTKGFLLFNALPVELRARILRFVPQRVAFAAAQTSREMWTYLAPLVRKTRPESQKSA
jgi:hypothetical protein